MQQKLLGVLLAAGLLTAMTGCKNGGDFSLFGYSTAPPYDPHIRSVYIPAVKNVAFHTSPYRGIEADLTQAIIDELGRRRSPIRVVSDPARADTELIGTITEINKTVWNRNLSNLTRDMDVQIKMGVVWRDLRDGRILSGSRTPPPDNAIPFDPSLPQPTPRPNTDEPVPVQLMGSGRALPELGESNTTAAQTAVRNLAIKIVDMMEQPW